MRAPWDDPDYTFPIQQSETLKILRTEFSEKFVALMKNRMLVSYHRYGNVADAMIPKKDGPRKTIDAIESAIIRIRKYEQTGNVEFLVDASNFLMMEFMYPSHVNGHFEATDSDQSPGRVEASSGEIVPYSNRDLL